MTRWFNTVRMRGHKAARDRIRAAARADATGKKWYRIVNKGATADVYLFDEIGYWGVTAQDFVKELRDLSATSITVHINSPGGDVFDGVAIYNSLLSHPAKVTARIEGLAASAASFIAQAGTRVVMTRNAQMMIHDASGMCLGNSSDMRDMANLLDRASDNIADIYAQRAGGTVEQWREAMQADRGNGTWYSATEAVEAGLADEVAEESEQRAAASWDRQAARLIRQGANRQPSPLELLGQSARRATDFEVLARRLTREKG